MSAPCFYACMTRFGKKYYGVERHTEFERDRDRQMLVDLPRISREQVDRDVADLKAQWQEELSSRERVRPDIRKSVDTRARCWRNGRYIYMPRRHSADDIARDQAFLDAIPCRLLDEDLDRRVGDIQDIRNREIATGTLEGEPGDVAKKKRRKEVVVVPVLDLEQSV